MVVGDSLFGLAGKHGGWFEFLVSIFMVIFSCGYFREFFCFLEILVTRFLLPFDDFIEALYLRPLERVSLGGGVSVVDLRLESAFAHLQFVLVARELLLNLLDLLVVDGFVESRDNVIAAVETLECVLVDLSVDGEVGPERTFRQLLLLEFLLLILKFHSSLFLLFLVDGYPLHDTELEETFARGRVVKIGVLIQVIRSSLTSEVFPGGGVVIGEPRMVVVVDVGGEAEFLVLLLDQIGESLFLEIADLLVGEGVDLEIFPGGDEFFDQLDVDCSRLLRIRVRRAELFLDLGDDLARREVDRVQKHLENKIDVTLIDKVRLVLLIYVFWAVVSQDLPEKLMQTHLGQLSFGALLGWVMQELEIFVVAYLPEDLEQSHYSA